VRRPHTKHKGDPQAITERRRQARQRRDRWLALVFDYSFAVGAGTGAVSWAPGFDTCGPEPGA
jgi:hypothetical protein